LEEARAATFLITAFAQLFFAVGCRSWRYTMPEIGWLTNRALFWAIAASALLQIGVMSLPVTRNLLRTEILRPGDWVIVLVLSLIPVTVVEVAKLIRLAIKGRRSKPIGI
jgi:Ca2+-transporting ATPase